VAAADSTAPAAELVIAEPEAVPAPATPAVAVADTGPAETGTGPLPAPEADPAAFAVAKAVDAAPPVSPPASAAPRPRPEDMFAEAAPVPDALQATPEVVTRISTSGGRHWGINVGRYPSRAGAERQLLRTALAETATLNDGLRKVVERGGEYDANFVGLTQDQADLACRRLQARAVQCFTMGP
jgi:D-alanyl-D-alanine carboxypeptidase